MENQLTILAESLEQKLQVLGQIRQYNLRQEQAFTQGTVKLEDFDAAVEEKGRLIAQLNRLDEGFETLYAHLSEQLQANRAQYASQIRSLQQQIARITELSVTIQAQERRNKQLVEQYFSRERDNIRQGRKNANAALNYYRSANNTFYAPPQYYDSKK